MIDAARIAAGVGAVEGAMHRSERVAGTFSKDHWQAFKRQMREKVGADDIAFDEPYLPFLKASAELKYLRRMARVERRVMAAAADKKGMEHKAFDADEPFLPQVEAIINAETHRAGIEAKQDLDSARQQSFGIGYYVWEGGDCPLCASYNGQIFKWGEGEEPGGVHINCNCYGDPIVDDPLINDPPITPVYPIENLISLLAAAGLARKLGLEAIERAGSAGRRLAERLRREEAPTKPAEKPQTTKPAAERPKNVPKDWEQLPADKGEGTKYFDPRNRGNDIRIQKGDPNSQYPHQRKDYVKWKKNGQWLDKNGNPLFSGKLPEAHIPLDEFNFDLEIF